MLARNIRFSWVLAATFAALVPPVVVGETLAINGEVTIKSANIETPQRGSSMSAVQAKFGEPANKEGPVGNPAITKWFYPNFVVVFENDKVLHSVVISS